MISLIGFAIVTLLLSVAVERATEILHSAKITFPLRNWLALTARFDLDAPVSEGELSPHSPTLLFRKLARFFSAVLSCGYCTSMWVSGFAAHFYHLPQEIYTYLGVIPLGFHEWVFKTLVLHAGSNIYHVLYERARKGRIKTIDHSGTVFVTMTQAVEITNGSEGTSGPEDSNV
jgi:hypothetical protein